jgi:hypothetical protein
VVLVVVAVAAAAVVVMDLFQRKLMKLYLNIDNVARFCNLAAFQFCVQLPP